MSSVLANVSRRMGTLAWAVEFVRRTEGLDLLGRHPDRAERELPEPLSDCEVRETQRIRAFSWPVCSESPPAPQRELLDRKKGTICEGVIHCRVCGSEDYQFRDVTPV